MAYKEIVEKWTSFAGLEANLKAQLTELQTSDKLLEDSFYKHLEFGTGGMRGELWDLVLIA